jgi:ferredoxin
MTKIDKELCIGCGACVSTCPEGFEMSDGKAKIKNPKAKCLKEAISICPVNAIK